MIHRSECFSSCAILFWKGLMKKYRNECRNFCIKRYQIFIRFFMLFSLFRGLWTKSFPTFCNISLVISKNCKMKENVRFNKYYHHLMIIDGCLIIKFAEQHFIIFADFGRWPYLGIARENFRCSHVYFWFIDEDENWSYDNSTRKKKQTKSIDNHRDKTPIIMTFFFFIFFIHSLSQKCRILLNFSKFIDIFYSSIFSSILKFALAKQISLHGAKYFRLYLCKLICSERQINKLEKKGRKIYFLLLISKFYLRIRRKSEISRKVVSRISDAISISKLSPEVFIKLIFAFWMLFSTKPNSIKIF